MERIAGNINSADDLRRATSIVTFLARSDPYADQSGQEYADFIATRINWAEAFRHFAIGGGYGQRFEDEKNIYDAHLINSSTPELFVRIFSQKGAQERSAFKKGIFSEGSHKRITGIKAFLLGYRERNLPILYPVQLLVERMREKAEAVPVRNTFEIDSETLSKIDDNIRELVVILNHAGFETLQSCGGHDDEYVDSFLVRPLPKTSLTEAHRDLRALAEFMKNILKTPDSIISALREQFGDVIRPSH